MRYEIKQQAGVSFVSVVLVEASKPDAFVASGLDVGRPALQRLCDLANAQLEMEERRQANADGEREWRDRVQARAQALVEAGKAAACGVSPLVRAYADFVRQAHAAQVAAGAMPGYNATDGWEAARPPQAGDKVHLPDGKVGTVAGVEVRKGLPGHPGPAGKRPVGWSHTDTMERDRDGFIKITVTLFRTQLSTTDFEGVPYRDEAGTVLGTLRNPRLKPHREGDSGDWSRVVCDLETAAPADDAVGVDPAVMDRASAFAKIHIKLPDEDAAIRATVRQVWGDKAQVDVIKADRGVVIYAVDVSGQQVGEPMTLAGPAEVACDGRATAFEQAWDKMLGSLKPPPTWDLGNPNQVNRGVRRLEVDLGRWLEFHALMYTRNAQPIWGHAAGTLWMRYVSWDRKFRGDGSSYAEARLEVGLVGDSPLATHAAAMYRLADWNIVEGSVPDGQTVPPLYGQPPPLPEPELEPRGSWRDREPLL